MKRKTRSGMLYVLQADNGVYKLGCTTKKDVTNRLRYARSIFKTDFKVKLLSKRVKDVFGLENDMIWRMHHCQCYFPIDHGFCDSKTRGSGEIFYNCLNYVKEFMSKRHIDYLEY